MESLLKHTKKEVLKREFDYSHMVGGGIVSFKVAMDKKTGGEFILEPDFSDVTLANMTREGLLSVSIAKWRSLADFMKETGHRIADNGASSCALCQVYMHRFNSNHKAGDCRGCPIAEKTGKQYCELSPYMEFKKIFQEDGVFNDVSTGIDRAEQMVDYLVRLRDSAGYCTVAHWVNLGKFMAEIERIGSVAGDAKLSCDNCNKTFRVIYKRQGPDLSLEVGFDGHWSKVLLPRSYNGQFLIGV